ncbi:MAG TPA: bifunctional DNA-formamidopyrimidine glycosylase/DNA-(apurinic or apyrimidinic site) lyase [Pantanalinema sp.]
MPELPEVETIRTDLEPLLLGRRITRVAQALVDPHYRDLRDAEGRRVEALRRRGKYMIAALGDRDLVIHLGMTGQLAVAAAPSAGMRHLRVSFFLDDGTGLFFNDPRRFGRLQVVPPGAYGTIPTLAAMGPEPLSPEFGLEAFARRTARARTLKPLLLNQKVVAGLGNIYVDEALHLAGLHPERGALSFAEAERLHAAIREVLRHGIEHRGTTFRDYRDGMGRYGTNQDFLRVFAREKAACPVCSTPILKTRVGGRGTYYCPECQRA